MNHTSLVMKLQQCEREGITVPDELFDFLDILLDGAKKHGADNWLDPKGSKTSHKDMYASIGRHIADAMCQTGPDWESGKDPRLHAILRLNMDYVRDMKELKDD